jgi:hypothetical protein
MPKFAVFVLASADSEAGKMPTTQEFTDMSAFNEELGKAGILLAADGLHASTKGARIHYTQDAPPKPELGPFGLDNLVAGFWLWKLDSLEQAIEWASKIPFKEGKVEIRRIMEAEDFGPEFTDSLKEKEKELREKIEGVTH